MFIINGKNSIFSKIKSYKNIFLNFFRPKTQHIVENFYVFQKTMYILKKRIKIFKIDNLTKI